jgi:hypothetical protein
VIPATDGKNERSSDRKPKNATTTTDKWKPTWLSRSEDDTWEEENY